jgi:hypothetical protein
MNSAVVFSGQNRRAPRDAILPIEQNPPLRRREFARFRRLLAVRWRPSCRQLFARFRRQLSVRRRGRRGPHRFRFARFRRPGVVQPRRRSIFNMLYRAFS